MLKDNQYDSRKHNTCLTKLLDHQRVIHLMFCTLDFEKAFAEVFHQRLLSKINSQKTNTFTVKEQEIESMNKWAGFLQWKDELAYLKWRLLYLRIVAF